MKEKIRIFLETDLLEKYLLENTTEEESLQVERYIAMHPKVQEEYDMLQKNLEAFAEMHGVKTPDDLKEKITARIRGEKVGRKKFIQYAVAASITAILFAAATYFFYNENLDLQQKNTIVSNQIEDLKQDMKEQLEDVRNQFIVLQNPQTKKYTVRGNKKAKELKAVAYINPVKKLSYINVSKLPNLPENQCFQMWAEVNGEMVNLGVIKETSGKNHLMALPYAENAMGYITIEPQGGNRKPTVENIVANIAY